MLLQSAPFTYSLMVSESEFVYFRGFIFSSSHLRGSSTAVMAKGLPCQTFTTATQRKTKPANPKKPAPENLLRVIKPISDSKVVNTEIAICSTSACEA